MSICHSDQFLEQQFLLNLKTTANLVQREKSRGLLERSGKGLRRLWTSESNYLRMCERIHIFTLIWIVYLCLCRRFWWTMIKSEGNWKCFRLNCLRLRYRRLRQSSFSRGRRLSQEIWINSWCEEWEFTVDGFGGSMRVSQSCNWELEFGL